MEVIKKRGRPQKIKTKGGDLEIKIKHSSDSDSDNGEDGKGAGLGVENFVAREKKATEKPMVGGKVFALTPEQIKDLIK